MADRMSISFGDTSLSETLTTAYINKQSIYRNSVKHFTTEGCITVFFYAKSSSCKGLVRRISSGLRFLQMCTFWRMWNPNILQIFMWKSSRRVDKSMKINYKIKLQERNQKYTWEHDNYITEYIFGSSIHNYQIIMNLRIRLISLVILNQFLYNSNVSHPAFKMVVSISADFLSGRFSFYQTIKYRAEYHNRP